MVGIESRWIEILQKIVEILDKSPDEKPFFRVREHELDAFLSDWAGRARRVLVTPQAKRRIIDSIEDEGVDSPWISLGFIAVGGALGFLVAHLACASPPVKVAAACGGAALALLGAAIWKNRDIEVDYHTSENVFSFKII